MVDEFRVAMDFAKRLTGDMEDRSHRGINRSKYIFGVYPSKYLAHAGVWFLGGGAAAINHRAANWEISNAVALCSGVLGLSVYLSLRRRGVTRKVEGQGQTVTSVAGQISPKEATKKALIKPNLIQI